MGRLDLLYTHNMFVHFKINFLHFIHSYSLIINFSFLMFLRFLIKVFYLYHFYTLALLSSSIPLFTSSQIPLFKLLLLHIYVYVNYTHPIKTPYWFPSVLLLRRCVFRMTTWDRVTYQGSSLSALSSHRWTVAFYLGFGTL